MEYFELKVGRESGETIKAIAAELGVPVEHVVSIALEWFADVRCTPEGPVWFTDWLQDRSARAGWKILARRDEMEPAWKYAGDEQQEKFFYRCAYCGAGVRRNEDPNIKLFLTDTDRVWKREAKFHAPGCLWLSSRGRTSLPDAGATGGTTRRDSSDALRGDRRQAS